MRFITKHIPNAITCLNLFAGCLACVVAFKGIFILAAYLVMLAAIFDFLDGFAARLFKAYSPLGKELDSLADIVSFGVAPGFVLFSFLTHVTGSYWAMLAFLIPIFSALRLAKFNIDERQTSSFIGLPTPANAIFWVFLISSIKKHYLAYFTLNEFRITTTILIGIFCFLLVSEIPMFSLKFKNAHWKNNKIRFVFLLASITLIFWLKFKAFPFIIGLYILLSLLNWAYQSFYVKSSNEV